MIVFGDIHGAYRTLKALIARLPDDKLCFVGDLIDRGPLSKHVIQFVIDGGHHCVLGNHEDMALFHHGRRPERAPVNRKFSSNIAAYDKDIWTRNGGDKCLECYPDEIMSKEHLDFLGSLPYFLDFQNVMDHFGRGLFVSHTAIHTTIEESLKMRTWGEMDRSIIWNRGQVTVPENRFHIFGHTPHKNIQKGDNWANIDTGWHRKITAMQYPSMQVWQQDYIG